MHFARSAKSAKTSIFRNMCCAFGKHGFTQIKPLKRGGGRRYYRPADVELLKGIRHLLYDQGYTIKGVQRLLKDNGNQFVIALGSGDKAAADEIARQRLAAHQGGQEADRCAEKGCSRTRSGRRCAGWRTETVGRQAFFRVGQTGGRSSDRRYAVAGKRQSCAVAGSAV